MKKDINTLSDVKTLVDQFYAKVQVNPLIGPIFIGVIKNNWPVHLQKMYSFWQTILLDEPTYSGRPFPPHAQMALDKKHFETWLNLFRATVNENFEGEKAKEAIWRAEKMAEMFHHKIQYFKQNSL